MGILEAPALWIAPLRKAGEAESGIIGGPESKMEPELARTRSNLYQTGADTYLYLSSMIGAIISRSWFNILAVAPHITLPW